MDRVQFLWSVSLQTAPSFQFTPEGIERNCDQCLRLDRVPQSDRRREERVKVHTGPGVDYLELQRLTSGGLVGWLESFRCRNNVNKAAHDFVRHGDRVSLSSPYMLWWLRSCDDGS